MMIVNETYVALLLHKMYIGMDPNFLELLIILLHMTTLLNGGNNINGMSI